MKVSILTLMAQDGEYSLDFGCFVPSPAKSPVSCAGIIYFLLNLGEYFIITSLLRCSGGTDSVSMYILVITITSVVVLERAPVSRYSFSSFSPTHLST